MRRLKLSYALLLTLGGTAMAWAQDPVLVGAGDIAGCNATQLANSQATANLLDAIPGTVFAVGDLVYPDPAGAYFDKCWAPTWGRHRARMTPETGNHEYDVPGAFGYYNYFGPVAAEPAKGYYSYDLGAWHVIILNAECSQIGNCTATSPEGRWLSADLAAHPAACTLAIWHEPLFTSSSAGSPSVRPFWQILYDAGADLIVNGHKHQYERFAPQDPIGNPDPARGIREIVAGTGGVSLGCFATILANSEVRECKTYGVLKLTLHPTSYDWEFVPQAGKTFTDSGTTLCH